MGVEHEAILANLTLRSLLSLRTGRPAISRAPNIKNPSFRSLEFGVQHATRTHPSWLLYISIFFPLPCPLRLTLVRVSTSHQKVVLEIDFSGSLWVRCLTYAPLNDHRSPQQRPLLTSRDTPKLPLYQTIQTFGLFISILDSAVCSSCCTFRLPSV